MPDEITFDFYDLELIVVHLCYNFGGQLLVKERKCTGQPKQDTIRTLDEIISTAEDVTLESIM